MKTYQITNKSTGHDFGRYDGASGAGAIAAMLADANHDGPADADVIATEVPRATVALTSYNMGDASEADYDAWVSYVSERIDERTGLDVTVESLRFGESGEDRCDDDEHEESVKVALRVLWDDFCADDSAWPAKEIRATASNPRATSTGVERAIDVDVRLTRGDVTIDGAVTLLPAADGRDVYESWGSADMWIDGRTLGALKGLSLEKFREACDVILDAAQEAAGRPSEAVS